MVAKTKQFVLDGHGLFHQKAWKVLRQHVHNIGVILQLDPAAGFDLIVNTLTNNALKQGLLVLLREILAGVDRFTSKRECIRSPWAPMRNDVNQDLHPLPLHICSSWQTRNLAKKFISGLQLPHERSHGNWKFYTALEAQKLSIDSFSRYIYAKRLRHRRNNPAVDTAPMQLSGWCTASMLSQRLTPLPCNSAVDAYTASMLSQRLTPHPCNWAVENRFHVQSAVATAPMQLSGWDRFHVSSWPPVLRTPGSEKWKHCRGYPCSNAPSFVAGFARAGTLAHASCSHTPPALLLQVVRLAPRQGSSPTPGQRCDLFEEVPVGRVKQFKEITCTAPMQLSGWKPLPCWVSGWHRSHATQRLKPLPCSVSGWHRSPATQRLKPLHAAACHRFHALFPQRHIIFSSRIQQRIIFILNKCRSSLRLAVLCHKLQEMTTDHLHLIVIHRPLLNQLIEISPRNHDLEVACWREHCQI